MWVSHNGHVDMVDKLLQHGATVDLQENVNNVIKLLATQSHVHIIMCACT